MKDSLEIIGKVRIQLLDKDGNLKQDSGFQNNLITNAGKAAAAGLIANTGAVTAFTYFALGTSSTAAAVTDTTLGAEITDTGLARTAATISRITTSVTNDTLQFTYTWTATGVKTIQEVGIFNASSSGTMLTHKILSASITTANTDQVTVTYTLQLS